jgi:transcriptional regulator with XRE-family HTH domain
VRREAFRSCRLRRGAVLSTLKRTTTNRLGELLRDRRAALRLTQRSLAEKLGVEATHLALIEGGRRKPSLKLVVRIADSLGLNRQDVLLLAHPEARALLFGRDSEPRRRPPLSWRRFIKNNALLVRYQVTKPELEILEHLSLLGTAISIKEFLAVLMLIRDIPEHN